MNAICSVMFPFSTRRITLTCLAFNTAQVYRLQSGQRLAFVAIRRLRPLRERELGKAPAVIYLTGCYGVFSLEEFLSLLGTPPRESLLPALRKASSSDVPTRSLISKYLDSCS
jgi:hypothetical protein